MVASAEVGADLVEGQFGEFSGKVHADLPGEDNAPSAAFGAEQTQVDLKLPADALGDAFDRGPGEVGFLLKVGDGGVDIGWCPASTGELLESGQRAFEL